VGYDSLAAGRWSWPGTWAVLLLLAGAGIYQLVVRVQSAEIQARLYFQGVLFLLAVARVVLCSRQLVSVEVDSKGLRLQTAGEPHTIGWAEVLAVVATPRGLVIRTRHGDFELRRRQSGSRRVHDALLTHGVHRISYEPGPPLEWTGVG